MTAHYLQPPLIASMLASKVPVAQLASRYDQRQQEVIQGQLRPYLYSLGVPNWTAPNSSIALRVLQLFQALEAGELTKQNLQVLFQLDDTLFHPLLAKVVQSARSIEPEYSMELVDIVLSLIVNRPGIDPTVKQEALGYLPINYNYKISAHVADPLLQRYKINSLRTTNSAVIELVGNGSNSSSLAELNASGAKLSNSFHWPVPLNGLQTIDLSHNQYTGYPFGDLRMTVYTLNMDYNLIEVVDEKWTNLRCREVRLAHNYLQEFPGPLLRCFDLNASLILDYNPTISSRVGTPKLMTYQVERYKEQLDVTAFTLSMRHCNLRAVPVILGSIINILNYRPYRLDFSYNYLTNFELELIYDLTLNLRLQYNRLTKLDCSKIVVSSFYLLAAHNRLREVILPAETRLAQLEYNPLRQLTVLSKVPLKNVQVEHTLLS